MPNKRHKRSMLWQIIYGLTAGVIIGYLGLCLFAVFFADRMIFPAQPATYADGPEIIKLNTASDLKVSALYLENPEAEYTILYSHGNAEDLGDIRPTLETLRRMGYAIIAYDYPGYGTSEGQPSVSGSYEAVSAAYDYLINQQEVEPERIIAFGRSLGSGPTFQLASNATIGGIIIDGGYTSTFRVVTKVKLLPWDKFDNLAAVEAISCPTLFLHGQLDGTVPFSHAQAMYAASSGPKAKLFIPEAGHNNLIECAGPRYWDAIRTFTQSLNQPHE